MSKTYRIFLTLIIVFCPGVMPLQIHAQTGTEPQTERHYRIEILLLRHLQGQSDTAPQATLRDFTEILDLHAPPEEEENSGDAADPPAESPQGVDEGQSDTEEMIEPEEPLAIRVDEMSETMREAWRRLRLSAGFRPELFRAWEQSGDEPFPLLRIHDDEILFEIDPAMQPSQAPVDEYGALVFSDATMDVKAMEDAGAMDDDPAEEEEQPPVRYYYRIDGTASLRRSRFLHMDLDVEFREPLFETSAIEQNPVGSTAGPNGLQLDSFPAAGEPGQETASVPAEVKTGAAADATEFRIHSIRQRRQVKTEQMEYFDGPVIGVLVFITGFDVIPEESAE